MDDKTSQRQSHRTASEAIGEIRIEGHVRVDIDSEAGRFEIAVGEDTAVLEATVDGTVLSIVHTEIPTQLRGAGLGEALARAALEYARTRGMRVKPYCAFVAGFVDSHPEYQDLVVSGFRSAENRRR
jgi:uncharacterized protein